MIGAASGVLERYGRRDLLRLDGFLCWGLPWPIIWFREGLGASERVLICEIRFPVTVRSLCEWHGCCCGGGFGR